MKGLVVVLVVLFVLLMIGLVNELMGLVFMYNEWDENCKGVFCFLGFYKYRYWYLIDFDLEVNLLGEFVDVHGVVG